VVTVVVYLTTAKEVLLYQNSRPSLALSQLIV